MSASTSHNRVIAMFQSHDKLMTARSLCHRFDFGIRCIRPSHADILADGQVEQKIILGYIANQIHYLLWRKFFCVNTSNGDMPASNIPIRGDKFRNRGFTRAGRSYQCRCGSLLDVQGDAVQNLCILISKSHIPQGNIQSFEIFPLGRTIQIRLGQYGSNFSGDSSNFRKIIRQKDSCNQWPHNAKRKNGNGDKVRSRQRAVHIEQASHRQHTNQYGRPNRHHQSRIALGGFHPVQHEIHALTDSLCKLSIGGSTLIERLDDLNPIDVLHSGGAHILTCLNNSTVFFRVFLHLGHVTEHPDRYRNQGYQCHSPIQHKQVNNDGDGDKQVRSHFRDDMCQRDFHLLHTLYHCGFQPSRRCIRQISHRNTR